MEGWALDHHAAMRNALMHFAQHMREKDPNTLFPRFAIRVLQIGLIRR